MIYINKTCSYNGLVSIVGCILLSVVKRLAISQAVLDVVQKL
jgi:hypothetical protein